MPEASESVPAPSAARAGLLVPVLGLACLVGLAAALLQLRSGPADPAALWSEVFGAGPPHGWALVDGVRLPGRESLVHAKSDPLEVSSAEPADLYVRIFSSAAALSKALDEDSIETVVSVSADDRDEQLEKWTKQPDFSFSRALETRLLSFGAWSANCVRVRAWLEGGTTEEWLRVNLGQRDCYAMVSARWPAGIAASMPALEALLEGCELRSVAVR